MTPVEAAGKIPVRIRGVVVRKGAAEFSIVDDTAGLYVEGSAKVLSGFAGGDLVEVEGVSDPGKFAPYLKAQKVRRLGKGELPPAQKPDRDALLSGRMDGQWIEVSGIVRRVEPQWGGVNFEINLENGGGRMLARADGLKRVVEVDSTVRVRGICFYQFNNAGQVFRPFLSAAGDEPIIVIRPAQTNLDALPLCSVGSLLQFSVERDIAHRLRVRGSVTYSQPGEGFWIHDAGHGLHVACAATNLPPVGAEVEVLGFLKSGGYAPEMEDAIFRKTGKALPVLPTHLAKAGEALGYDSDLVECEAVIREQWTALDGCRLKLSDGATEFSATFRTTNHSTIPPDWLPGARVRVAGICSVGFSDPKYSGPVEPQFFQMLLRSPADVTVLQPAPWWNSEHIAWVFGITSAALLTSVGIVIWISRRQLREQALARMKSEAEFAAVWNERTRMAREIHDTLAQGLSAISIQLEVVKRLLPPEAKVRESLEVARQLARAKLTEARNAIWNVRSQVLETGDLGTAFQNILRTLTEGTETKGELRVRGKLRRLAPFTENNLLRMGQEAITNAAKYAEARNILVALDYEEHQVRISISDDGKGFDVQSPPPSAGGFGLRGMQERAAQLHAEFAVSSEPGEGTIVTLVLPLST